jgi:di/tricarboxylate transporter
MKPLFVAGLIVMVLGIVLLFVPIPHSENHGVKAGDVRIGVTTTHHERVSPMVSAVLIIAGAGLMLGGRSR